MKTAAHILVAGATGYLGGHLCRALLYSGYRLTGLKRTASQLDLSAQWVQNIDWIDTDDPFFSRNVLSAAPDGVINCVTSYGRQKDLPHSLIETEVVEANFFFPLKLLNILRSSGKLRFFIQTGTVLPASINGYALAKSQLSAWLSRINSPAICELQLDQFYGPCDSENKFPAMIVRSLLRNCDKLELTEGAQQRFFIYIDDVVAAFMILVNNALNGSLSGYQKFAADTVRLYTVREFVETAAAIIGSDTDLQFGAQPYREGELMKTVLDSSSLRGLGWEPHFDLRKGLEKMIALEKEQFV